MPVRRHTSPSLIFGAGAAVVVALGLLVGWQARWPPLLTLLGAVNLATLLLYGYDKAVAGRRGLRVPEVVLHLLAGLGGTLAALLGQRLLRHKISKYAFQRVFIATVVVQAALLGGLTWCWVTRPGWFRPVGAALVRIFGQSTL